MTPLEENATKINALGETLVNCCHCSVKDGIINKPSEGVIPRCLVIENRNGKEQCIIVGESPGQISNPRYKVSKIEKEWHKKEFEKNGKISYKSYKKCWEKHVKPAPYYKRLRNIVNQLGFAGSILWTDLIKCEKNKKTPDKTFQECIENYLEKELKWFPNLIIVAAGKDAFNKLKDIPTQKQIMGVYHPSQQNIRRFKTMFINGNIKGELREEIKLAWENNKNKNIPIWLPDFLKSKSY